MLNVPKVCIIVLIKLTPLIVKRYYYPLHAHNYPIGIIYLIGYKVYAKAILSCPNRSSFDRSSARDWGIRFLPH